MLTYFAVIPSKELQDGKQLALKLNDHHFLDLCPDRSRLGLAYWEIIRKGDFQVALILSWGADLTSGVFKGDSVIMSL